MSETGRLLEAASALSQLLTSQRIPHAFHGGFLAAVLCNKSRGEVGLFSVLLTEC